MITPIVKSYGISENHVLANQLIFNGDKVIGAILFENTMDREVAGKSAADFLWDERRIVPFLKVDKGLADENNGVQLMKPMPDLESLLRRASAAGIFGTKMRSVIKVANPDGVDAVVDQQFEIGNQILEAGLIPIIEPEVDIHSPEKSSCEGLMRDAIFRNLDSLNEGHSIMLKLTLPEEDNFYSGLVESEKVLRVVALSGGYSREEANARMSRNNGVVASFSRALTEGLSALQSQGEFDSLLNSSIQSIFDASGN